MQFKLLKTKLGWPIYILVCERDNPWPLYNGNKPADMDCLLPSFGRTFSIDIHRLSIRKKHNYLRHGYNIRRTKNESLSDRWSELDNEIFVIWWMRRNGVFSIIYSNAKKQRFVRGVGVKETRTLLSALTIFQSF